MSDHINPPWSTETVNHLNQYQWSSGMHPFTCPEDSHHILVATCDGWLCPMDDGYEQDWAHAFMAQPNLWPSHNLKIWTRHNE